LEDNLRLTEILEEHDLQEYTATFLENGITDEQLSELTDADLRELGIGAMGVRKRLLKEFAGTAGGLQESVSVTTKPVAMPDSEEERQYYSGHGVSITSRRITTADGTTIAINHVNTVKTLKDDGRGAGAVIGFFVGLIVVILGVTAFGGSPDSPNVMLFGWMAMILGGLLGFRLFPVYWVFQIQTSSGETKGFRSDDKLIVDEMVDALNEALVNHRA
jgi:hypothetical protein